MCIRDRRNALRSASSASPARLPSFCSCSGAGNEALAAHTVRFWEMLIEKGSGVSSGGDDFAPGGGFSAGTYKTGGKERSGSIETVSSLFGKDYSYQWDYAAVRTG